MGRMRFSRRWARAGWERCFGYIGRAAVEPLSIAFPGAPPQPLIHIKGLQFRTPRFADDIYEFVLENGQVKAMKERDPSGEFSYPRQ